MKVLYAVMLLDALGAKSMGKVCFTATVDIAMELGRDPFFNHVDQSSGDLLWLFQLNEERIRLASFSRNLWHLGFVDPKSRSTSQGQRNGAWTSKRIGTRSRPEKIRRRTEKMTCKSVE